MSIKFTRRGYIEVWMGGQKLSQHTQEREAIESISRLGDGDYVIRYPEVAVRVIGSVANQTGGDTEAPTVPQNVIATAVDKNQIDASWDASTDNVGVTGYHVFANGIPQPDVSAGTSASITGLTPSTLYSITVAAFDASGNTSAASDAATATTPANSAPVWTAIDDQDVIVGDSFNLDLSGYVADADAEDTLTYSVASGTLPSGLSLGGSIVSGTPTTAGQTPTIVFRVDDGNDTADETVSFTSWTADVTAPPVPTGLTATVSSSSQIDVSWSASVDASGGSDEYVSGTQDYRIYRDGSLRTTVTSTSYGDTGLSASTSYSYTVSARDVELNESAQSSASSATTSANENLGINPGEDWTTRTAGDGVLYAENFSGFTDSTDLQTYEDISNPSRITLETTHALSGKTCRVTTLPTDGEVSNGMILSLNGRQITGQATPGDVYKRFYVQFIVWGDDYFNWPFQSSSNNAPKVFILDRCCAANGESYGPSANPGEVVIDHQGCRGFVHSYRRLTEAGNSFESWDKGISTPANSSNFQWQNAVDNGNALSTQATYEQRYGPFYDGMTGVSHTSGTRLTTQHGSNYPDPDAAAGGIAWNIGGYTVVEIFVDYDLDKCLIWASHYGDDPKLIIDSDASDGGAALFNNRSDIDGWSGFHLSTFRTGGAAESGVRPSMYTDYPEVIVSTEPIPFPGNKPLPGALDNAPLVDLAATTAAGAWGTLSVPTMTGSLINNGSIDSIMSWARRGHADLDDDKLYFYGCTHDGADPAKNYNYFINYALGTNTWAKETINEPEPYSSNGIHSYYHFALRESDGHQFVRRRPSPATVYDRARGGAWGTSLVPSIPGDFFIEYNVANALEWYPDYNGGAGALIFASQNRVYKWATGDVSWTLLGSFGPAGSGNDNWICYNRANSRLYFGGGGDGQGTVMRRLDPDGTITSCAAVPFNCGTSSGSVISSGLSGNKMFAVENLTGDIVEYNHVGDSWSGDIDALPFTPDGSGGFDLYFFITVPDLGVIFHYISGNPNPSSTMHFWKR